MDELISQVLRVLRGMWRRRWMGLLAAWIVAGIGSALVLRVPERYEATATVFVDTKSVLKPLMRELTVEPDIDQKLQLLAKTLITRPNIEVLMKKANLVTPGMTVLEREALIARLTREIKLSSFSRDNVFTFSYRDTNMATARLVVEKLVTLFVESDLGAKTRDTDAARGFIDTQIKAYETRLAEAETRLKDFKIRNMGVSDPSGKDYFTRISALTDELSKVMVDLQAAEQGRDARKRELSGEVVNLVPDVPPPSSANQVTEFDARLDAQRRQLDELLRRYTELHPDVVASRRLITRLEEQRQMELDARRRNAVNAPLQPTNSLGAAVQQQTRLALAEAEATVASLRVRAKDTQARLAQLRSSASRVPQVEAELAQLNRDYEVVRRNYEALVAQREKASMSEEVDATRLAQFRVIDPPRTSDKPVFPDRKVLVAVVLVLSLFVGAAVSFLMIQLVPTIGDAQSLRRFTGRPVLGSVSMLSTPESLGVQRRRSMAFVAGLGGLFMAFSAWFVFLTLPART